MYVDAWYSHLSAVTDRLLSGVRGDDERYFKKYASIRSAVFAMGRSIYGA
jgi:hypothetical protein